MGRDWRSAAGLTARERELCAFAERLTRQPGDMRAADLDRLRAVGLDDTACHDAIQVIAYFNYINRVADAVHVKLEPEMAPYPEHSEADSRGDPDAPSDGGGAVKS